MKKDTNKILAIVAGLLFFGADACFSADRDGRQTRDIVDGINTSQFPTSASRTFFLALGKSKAADPPQQQERAIVAVRKVTNAAKQFQPSIIVEALTEDVMTRKQLWRGEVEVKVNGAIFQKRLQQFAQTVGSQDTVIIYTHSHGTRDGSDTSQPLGGILLDPGPRRPESRAIFPWDEYAELILNIPAKNVMVLTMSCFSGGLAEHFNSPDVRNRWNDRRRSHGRNFIVLTSQNSDLLSPPIVKGGELINPFTYAVAEAFAGKADGFELVGGKPERSRRKDGKLTIGELIDFILYTTENTSSETPQRRNIAKPQLTGSFDRKDVLLVNAGGLR